MNDTHSVLTTRERLQNLANENAKMRKLLRDMYRDFANADCELKQRHGRTFMVRTRYKPSLRELGIEVD